MSNTELHQVIEYINTSNFSECYRILDVYLINNIVYASRKSKDNKKLIENLCLKSDVNNRIYIAMANNLKAMPVDLVYYIIKYIKVDDKFYIDTLMSSSLSSNRIDIIKLVVHNIENGINIAAIKTIINNDINTFKHLISDKCLNIDYDGHKIIKTIVYCNAYLFLDLILEYPHVKSLIFNDLLCFAIKYQYRECIKIIVNKCAIVVDLPRNDLHYIKGLCYYICGDMLPIIEANMHRFHYMPTREQIMQQDKIRQNTQMQNTHVQNVQIQNIQMQNAQMQNEKKIIDGKKCIKKIKLTNLSNPFKNIQSTNTNKLTHINNLPQMNILSNVSESSTSTDLSNSTNATDMLTSLEVLSPFTTKLVTTLEDIKLQSSKKLFD